MKFKPEHLRLYAITDRHYLPEGMTLGQAVEAAIEGGVTMVQLREKDMDPTVLKAVAIDVMTVCRRLGVPFLVDDDVWLAKEIGADGVHVGQDDMPADEARRILGPDAIIGVTAKTIEQAQKAQADGADYLGSGAMFVTSTKPEARPMTCETLREITKSVSIPVCAIGGIKAENVGMLAGTGIAGVAVAGGIFDEPDTRAAAKAVREALVL